MGRQRASERERERYTEENVTLGRGWIDLGPFLSSPAPIPSSHPSAPVANGAHKVRNITVPRKRKTFAPPPWPVALCFDSKPLEMVLWRRSCEEGERVGDAFRRQIFFMLILLLLLLRRRVFGRTKDKVFPVAVLER